MKELKELSNDELIQLYVEIELEAQYIQDEYYDSIKEKRYSVGEAITDRNLLLEAEVALGIAENRITQKEVDELLAKDNKTLIESLTDGENAYNDYYGNMYYMQKYEDDETFIKAGDSLLIGNTIIRLILEKRGVEVD